MINCIVLWTEQGHCELNAAENGHIRHDGLNEPVLSEPVRSTDELEARVIEVKSLPRLCDRCVSDYKTTF